MWVVAASPNSLAAGGVSIGPSSDDNFIAMLPNGMNGEGLALNFGNYQSYSPSSEKYFQASDWATGVDREWGPSSEHAGNIVMHVWADVHAKALSAEVDPTVYLRFITRSAGDPASEAGL